MVAMAQGFNAADYKDVEEYEILPEMKAKVIITKSEEIATAKGGSMKVFHYEILEPESHKGKKAKSNHNTGNANKDVEAGAWREIAAISKAVRVMTPRDTQELHNLPLVIKITVKPQKEDDPDKPGQKRVKINPATGRPFYENAVRLWEPVTSQEGKATVLTPPAPLPDMSPIAGYTGQAAAGSAGAPPAGAQQSGDNTGPAPWKR